MRQSFLVSSALWFGCASSPLANITPPDAMAARGPWTATGTRTNIVPFAEAGAAIAAAAAIKAMVKENPHPNLFSGCASPEQGLDVAVFTGPTAGLYYVLVDQRFDRCGGPSVRVLDGWYEYAVTPQGEVVGHAPPPPAEDSTPPMEPPAAAPPPAEPTQPPAPNTAPTSPPSQDNG